MLKTRVLLMLLMLLIISFVKSFVNVVNVVDLLGELFLQILCYFSVRISENHSHPRFVNVVNVVDPHVL